MASLSEQIYVPAIRPENLGDSEFKRRHSLKYAYVAGAMANGIASTALVKTMGENGMLGFFGAGGLSLEQIETAILELKTGLGDKPFGFN
ncbi:MAG TPA: 2-nitropropane dioxygenase, partial [Desulfobacter postgatei]|nr:2-nitropropane dioxygenase [Desulfobacter postgatei]